MDNANVSDSSTSPIDTLPQSDNANGHLWVNKPPTKSKMHPKVVCRQCRIDKNIKIFTNQICKKCNIGLCSQLCYAKYHGLDVCESDQATTEHPRVSKTKAELKSYDDRQSNVDSDSDLRLHLSSESPSSSDLESSDTSLSDTVHLLESVPSTKCKTKAQLRCRQCRREHHIRKDTRYRCSGCKYGICGTVCFEKYHLKKGFHLIPAARRKILSIPETPQKRSRSLQDESLPGPSGSGRRKMLASSTSGDVDSPSSAGSKKHRHVKKPPTPKKNMPKKHVDSVRELEGVGRIPHLFVRDVKVSQDCVVTYALILLIMIAQIQRHSLYRKEFFENAGCLLQRDHHHQFENFVKANSLLKENQMAVTKHRVHLKAPKLKALARNKSGYLCKYFFQ